MATDSSSPSNNKTSAVSSQSSESLSRRPDRRASPLPHEYTSLHDLLEFPCTCPLCTYIRQRRQPGSRPEPAPQLAGSIVTRLALATLLPTAVPPPTFRSKRLLLRRFLRGPRAPADACLEFLNRLIAAAISPVFERLVGAFQEAEEDGEGGASPCGRLPFATC